MTVVPKEAPSFLQTTRKEVQNLLQRARGQTQSVEIRKEKALNILRQEANG